MRNRDKISTEKLEPPCYEEVIEIDRSSLPSYWQAREGETLSNR